MRAYRNLSIAVLLSLAAFAPIVACVADEGGGVPLVDSGVATDSGNVLLPDAGNGDDAAPTADAGGDANKPACNLTGDFGNVKPLPGLNAVLTMKFPAVLQSLDATLTDDEELMYFSACESTLNVDKTCDIYEAKLNQGTVTDIKKAANLSSADFYDRHPTLSADGKRLFMLRSTPSGGKIHVSSRADVFAAFPAPVVVDSVSPPSGTIDTDPFFARSDTLYFMRGMAAGIRTVHYATVGASSISNPKQLSANLNGLDPVMADKDETLLFVAQIVAPENQRQIRVAERTGATFGDLSQKYVAALNDNNKTSNFVNWISKDGCRMYFSRGEGQVVNYNILVAERPKFVP